MGKFASFNHAAPPPARVAGWYDTDGFEYRNLPAAEDLLELSDVEWEGRLSGLWAVADRKLVPWEASADAPQPWTVPKKIVIFRLAQAGLLRRFRAELQSGVADDAVTDENLLRREMWEAAVFISSADEIIQVALVEAGANPDQILAPT